MEFRVLGPVEVVENGSVCTPSPLKMRALLACLVVHPGRVLSKDELIGYLWGDTEPRTAVAALHVYVSQLRKLLDRASRSASSVAPRLITQPSGYQFILDSNLLDVVKFNLAVADAKNAKLAGDLSGASAALCRGLSVWQGPALSDVRITPAMRALADAMDEARANADEQLIELDLSLGRHLEAVPQLQRLIGEHRFREGLHVQLITALYRSGRRAEALGAYANVRRILSTELGLEPSRILQELYQNVLADRGDTLARLTA